MLQAIYGLIINIFRVSVKLRNIFLTIINGISYGLFTNQYVLHTLRITDYTHSLQTIQGSLSITLRIYHLVKLILYLIFFIKH